MKKLSQKEALDLALNTMQKNGATKENALPLALGIIDAENQGIKSHGFHYLPIYCLHLKCEKVKGSASPKLNAISNVAFKVNADNGFAHRAISLGMEKLIPSAKENGISSLAITNSYNCGVLGYHTKNIAKEKQITHMEAVLHYCEKEGIEPESVSSLISKGLKEKIEANARDLNFLPKQAQLPI